MADAGGGRLPEERLGKRLGLLEVYAISTGAMFSSGFFLLPGIASAQAGPAVALAYLLAGILVLPAMLSAAELSTAMPRAGGNYYFIDRSLGPMFGTIGGMGDWLALVTKSAFALVGMSAYIAIFFVVPIQPVAIALTILFAVLNVVGVKEATRLQVWIVVGLLLIMAYFLAAGVLAIATGAVEVPFGERFTPYTPFGLEGVIATTGLVFVSYSGLTKVASVSEEVRRPSRNLPLGMMLSLATATVVYVLGVTLMTAVLEPAALREDLTPVASAAEQFLPLPLGLFLIVAAAAAAFASTGNAGILSAARYPLAMGRDRLLWSGFARLGRSGSPTSAIVATSALMIVVIVALDEEGIAGVASAFNLLIFGLLNLAVIVMRESRIEAYVPGFRAPLYPWLQVFGIGVSVVLIAEIGMFTAFLTTAVVVGAVLWYHLHARHHVQRDGAIYHVFERLGRRRDTDLDRELIGIVQEQGLRDEDRYDEVIARAEVVELRDAADVSHALQVGADALAERFDVPRHALEERFRLDGQAQPAELAPHVLASHLLVRGASRPEVVVVRATPALTADQVAGVDAPVDVVFLVAGPTEAAGRVFRILAQLAVHVTSSSFAEEWSAARDEVELKETLLRDDRFVSFDIGPDAPSAELADMALRDVEFPDGSLVALVRRRGQTMVPRGSTVLGIGDRVTIVGHREAVQECRQRYLR